MLKPWLLALVVIFFVAVVLIAVGIPNFHMHPDEHLTFQFTQRGWSYMVWYLGAQDTHPPLWFTTAYLWRQIFGDGEFIFRVYSAFQGLITLALVYQLGRRWFGAGLFAVAALAVNGFFLYYTLEIRPYSMVMLLSALSMLTFERWLRLRTRRAAVFYGLTIAAMLYVHYFVFVLVVIQVIYFLAHVLRRRDLLILRQAGITVGVTLLVLLPWLPSIWNQIQILRQAELVGGNQRGIIGIGTTTVLTSPESIARLADLTTNNLPSLYLGLALLGLVLLRRSSNYRLALAWAFGAPALSFLLNLIIAVYTPRYVVYGVVGLSVVVGAALAALPLRGLVLLGFLALNLYALPAQINDLAPNRIPYRDLFQRASALVQPGDVIIFDHSGTNNPFFAYQRQQYLSPVFTPVSTIDEAATYARVWYVTDDLFNERRQQNFKQIEQDHPLREVIGQCNRQWCYILQLLARDS